MTPEELEKITERVIQRSEEFKLSFDQLQSDQEYLKARDEIVSTEDVKIEKLNKKLKEERDRQQRAWRDK